MSKFEKLYDHLPSPIPAVIEIIRYLFVSPSALLEAPLSRPVIQRLQWIKPTNDDLESYLYFNNMANHGICGRIEDLRIEMVHAGPSFWQVCSPEELEYRVDEQCLESDGLCEIFVRVAVWKIRDDDQPVPAQHKLGLILKLESTIGSDRTPNLLALPLPDMLSKDQLTWKYFDLQDLVTPGLDTRPWFYSAKLAATAGRSSQSQNGQPSHETDRSPRNDFWHGYESDSEVSSSHSSFGGSKTSPNAQITGSSVPIDPVLAARIRNTPVYRSKAPSVSSTNSHIGDDDDDPNRRPIIDVEGTPSLGGSKRLGPADFRSKISRTPLYKRAPSVEDDSPSCPSRSKDEKIEIDEIMQAAGIVNLSSRLQEAAASRALNSTDSQRLSSGWEESSRRAERLLSDPIPPTKSDIIQPSLSTINSIRSSSHPQLDPNLPSESAPSSRSMSQQVIEEKLLNSLRATYQLYSLSLGHRSPAADHHHLLNPGELFVALAHRVVLEESSSRP